jgi:tRNA threonylcarbamoyladenosine biosynthesis protein TsaB
VSLTLGITTATGRVEVAVGTPGHPLAAIALDPDRRHTETLAPAIRAATRLAGVQLGDLARVAVDAGPGLFTGLRVGVATAKALGAALSIPVVPCSSLDLLAHPHREWGRPLAAVVDARRGEVFWAVYRPGEGPVPNGPPRVGSPAAVAAALAGAGPSLLVTGNGARRYLAGRDLDLAPPEFDHPSAAAVLDLSATRPALAPEQVVPVYLREADVRIGWEQRGTG